MSNNTGITCVHQENVQPKIVEPKYCSPACITLVALGVLALIAGATATGLLYANVGYAAFGAVAAGAVVSLVLMAKAYFTWKLRQSQVMLPDENVQFPLIMPNFIEPNPHAKAKIEGKKPAEKRFNYARSCSNLDRTCMVGYSIIRRHNERLEAKNRVTHWLDAAKTESLCDREIRAMGIMLGMATGDALGAPIEFLPFKSEGYAAQGDQIHMNPAIYKGATAYNRRDWTEPGQWTDDTSMGLCLADILIEYRGLEETQLLLAFADWWNHGYNNAFTGDKPKGSIGLGGNISQSLRDCRLRRDAEGPHQTTAGDVHTSGNGSLMRLGAVAIAASSKEEAMQLAWRQSKVTHQGYEAAGCCQLMASLLYEALHSHENSPEARKKAVFDSLESFECGVKSVNGLAKSASKVPNPHPDAKQDENWNWKSPDFTYNANRLKAQPTYIGSYAMDGLAMALHCVYTTSSFEEAVRKAVGFGGDADTVGAIAGQIAGAIYGFDAIPPDWVNAVRKWDDGEIATRAYLLCHLD